MTNVAKLIARLGLPFNTPRLLESALVHRSYLHEHPLSDLSSNERLEFLGDAVLNFATAALLYRRFPQHSEGELTSLRAALVKTPTLAGFARQFELGAYLRLSKGEEAGRLRDSLLADAFEAMLAAIYIDQGLDTAVAFVTPLLEAQLRQIEEHGSPLDYKSRLQELIQAERALTPQYRTVGATGPDHQREFTVEVWAGAELLGIGVGSSKQAAAQNAAYTALSKLHV